MHTEVIFDLGKKLALYERAIPHFVLIIIDFVPKKTTIPHGGRDVAIFIKEV